MKYSVLAGTVLFMFLRFYVCLYLLSDLCNNNLVTVESEIFEIAQPLLLPQGNRVRLKAMTQEN